MSEPDEVSRPGARADHRSIAATDGEGPAFEEPWQATAFALAVHLSECGAIAWTEWSAALGREITAAAGDPAQAERYFQHWLRALERICAEKGMVGAAEIRARQEQWRRAYVNTPHGEPVELTASDEQPKFSAHRD